MDESEFASLTVVFGPEIWGLQSLGGISRYFLKLIENYEKNKVDVIAILTKNDNRLVSGLSCTRLISENDDEFYRLLFEISKEKQGPMIYHATYYDYKKIRIARKLGYKTFITIHDMISEIYPERKSIRNFFRNDKRSSARLADGIFCVSKNSQSDLVESFVIEPKKITVTYLGSIFEKAQLLPRTELFTSNTFLYVGKRDGYKNFDQIVNAFGNSRILKSQSRLIAFGGGHFSIFELSKFKALDLEKSIMHLDGDDDVLQSLYRESLALIYPSKYEGFGLPPLEAMSLGCPVIVGFNSSLPEVCGGAGIYFNSENVEELTRILERCIADPILMRRHSEIGLKKASDFSWSTTALESLDAYFGDF
jgi:glycosyltransferase involved in cell wall biosynthesis